MDGLLRYNAIQSALSPIRKQKGWKFPVGGFQEIASKIYQHTKKEPLKQVINNIDVLVEQMPGWEPPYLQQELQDWTEFYNFDKDAPSQKGVWTPELAENIYVKSPQLWGDDDYIVDSSLLSYEDHFKRFSDYCNANRGYWWTDSSQVPMFRFTEPVYDESLQKWLTVIELGQDDSYGYDPEIGPVVNEDVIIIPVSEREEKPQIKPEKKPKPEPKPEPEKPSEKELEIQKLQAQAELEKASTAKLTELNKAIDRLESQLDRGLITKQEYQKYLKRLMEF